jgi:PAS domain S-box-containing protein
MTKSTSYDFQGIGYSKIGYFKEVRSKIKELEKLNIELARRHHRLEAIFNGMSDGLTILDKDLNIVFTNEVQKQFFPDISLIDRKCFDAYYKHSDICKDCPAQRTFRTREILQGEAFVTSGKFARRYFEWTSSPIKGSSGDVEEVILIMRDVTQRKEYEHKLTQADRMAAIGFLAAGIAHEINNPLTSIAGFSEGLIKRLKKIQAAMDEPTFSSFSEYLNIILSEAYRCKDIIGNLQAFSRSSSDVFEILNVDQIIRDTLALFRQHAKDRGIKMNFETHASGGLSTISGKSSQLKHLFLDILNRAFQSMENGGAINLKTASRSNRIEITLAYNGGGATRNKHDTLYSPSRMRLDSDEVYTIDLSICYNIVQHHNGEIRFGANDVYSDVVTITFPLCGP